MDNTSDEEEQSYLISSLSACSSYQVMVTPVYGEDSRQGQAVVQRGQVDLSTRQLTILT